MAEATSRCLRHVRTLRLPTLGTAFWAASKQKNPPRHFQVSVQYSGVIILRIMRPVLRLEGMSAFPASNLTCPKRNGPLFGVLVSSMFRGPKRLTCFFLCFFWATGESRNGCLWHVQKMTPPKSESLSYLWARGSIFLEANGEQAVLHASARQIDMQDRVQKPPKRCPNED